jgi:hypothetical protein
LSPDAVRLFLNIVDVEPLPFRAIKGDMHSYWARVNL